MTPTDRITRYLLARQRRQMIRTLYRQMALSGLISPCAVDPEVKDFVLWQVSDVAASQMDDPGAVNRLIARALHADIPEDARVGHDLHIDVYDYDVRSGASGQVEREAPIPISTNAVSRAGEGVGRRDQRAVLSEIRKHLPPPSVAEVAVALLLARAVGTAAVPLDRIRSVLRMRDPFILVRVSVPEFEDCFGVMLDAGLVFPRRIAQVDGLGNLSLSGSYRDRRDGTHMITFSGRAIRKRSDDVIRAQLAKARLRHDVPVVVADELTTTLPSRFVVAADLVLRMGGIDAELIAELMHVCAGIAPKTSLGIMTSKQFDTTLLGIDDLVVAIRPGRSVETIVTALTELGAQNAEAKEDDDGVGGTSKSAAKKTQGKQSTPSKASQGANFELIDPADTRDTTVSDAVFVQDLAGYGNAKTWALELQTDLTAWRAKEIDWSAISTRLLLAGPPGTGKTTFARALRNTLAVPLLATSVAQWLEKGYLGDVLLQMAAAFEAASKAAPCILFIDELDNIGRRDTQNGQHKDYWRSLINRLLELLDGAGRRDGVIIIGATNDPDQIDPALLRSGRLETRIDIQLPDTDALAAILAHHLGGDLTSVLATRPVMNAPSIPDVRQLPAIRRRAFGPDAEPGRDDRSTDQQTRPTT